MHRTATVFQASYLLFIWGLCFTVYKHKPTQKKVLLTVWSYGCYSQSPFKCTVNTSIIHKLLFQIGSNLTEHCRVESEHAGCAICLDVAMVTHFVSLLMLGNLRRGVFRWLASWLIWIGLVFRTEQSKWIFLIEKTGNQTGPPRKLLTSASNSHPGFQRSLGSSLEWKPLQIAQGIVRAQCMCQIYSFSSPLQASSVSNNS